MTAGLTVNTSSTGLQDQELERESSSTEPVCHQDIVLFSYIKMVHGLTTTTGQVDMQEDTSQQGINLD